MDATAKAEIGSGAETGTGRRSGYTRHGAAQREALVQAAFNLIAERGFEGLRTRDVAARAGVNIATLHYYFATKEDLIRSVVDMLAEKFRTQQVPYLATQPRRNPSAQGQTDGGCDTGLFCDAAGAAGGPNREPRLANG